MKIVLPKLFASCILKYCQLYCKISLISINTKMTDFDYVQTASDEYSTSWKFGNRSFRRDTKLFRYKSFWYELKQLNCTKISITSRKVCSWKTFWVNILRSLRQVREPIYTSKTLKELTCIETTGNRKFERLGLAFIRNPVRECRRLLVQSSEWTERNYWMVPC